MSSIQVGVRVRQLIPKIDGNDVCCIKMNANQTQCTDILDTQKEFSFTFDFSFWSFDGYQEREDGYLYPKKNSIYKDQQYVFDKIGISVLDNAWLGYHTCLFAYGQTGSGKSYSMTGFGANKGVIPLAIVEIFKRISENNDPEKTYEVSCQMCEIYNEAVQDLILDPKKRPQGGLKVRESKTLGFYIEGLTKYPVSNYDQIKNIMQTGESNRSIGATLMNASSSRAHTITMIEFIQKIKHQGKTAQKVSQINLVDLAGSEKADQTGAVGDRLKESIQINQSLSSLGNVISAIVEFQNGKNIVVPYRDSNLTRILKNALGGNSKTYMICAIRPGAKFFDETVNTLRYADRVKQIKNKATINENQQDKLIRELKEENDRLRKQLEEVSQIKPQTITQIIEKEDLESKEKMKALQEQLEANQKEMANMEKSWEQKLIEAKVKQLELDNLKQQEEKAKLQGTPHLLNLNEDPMLDRKVIYSINKSEALTCGRRGNEKNHKIQLGGIGIEPDHAAFITQLDGSILLKPLSSKAISQIRVNGVPLDSVDGVVLKANDRICIGPSSFFLFKFPDRENEADIEDTIENPIFFDFANDEVYQNNNRNSIKEKEILQKKHEEATKKMMEDMQKRMEDERIKYEQEIKMKEEQFNQLEKNKQNEEQLKKMAQIIEDQKLAAIKQAEENKNKLMEEAQKMKTLWIQYEIVEQQLNQIQPQINEANLAAQELQRDIKFSTKMIRKFDPYYLINNVSQSKTEILVKVDNREDVYFYEWTVDKFQNRLFMIKDFLQKQIDNGKQNQPSKEDDPFWDPPNPVIIGQSFLQLEPLGLYIQNSLDAAILSIDGSSIKQGNVQIGYSPCNQNGQTNDDDLDQDFFVDHPNELIGKKNFTFKIFITSAQGLPANLSSNTFVSYQFKFDQQVYQTQQMIGENRNPQWNYEKIHQIDLITPQIANEFKDGVISFIIYGSAPLKINLNKPQIKSKIQNEMKMENQIQIQSSEQPKQNDADIQFIEKTDIQYQLQEINQNEDKQDKQDDQENQLKNTDQSQSQNNLMLKTEYDDSKEVNEKEKFINFNEDLDQKRNNIMNMREQRKLSIDKKYHQAVQSNVIQNEQILQVPSTNCCNIF